MTPTAGRTEQDLLFDRSERQDLGAVVKKAEETGQALEELGLKGTVRVELTE